MNEKPSIKDLTQDDLRLLWVALRFYREYPTHDEADVMKIAKIEQVLTSWSVFYTKI